MDTWSCREGWPAQGLVNGGGGGDRGGGGGEGGGGGSVDGGTGAGIISVCRSNEEDVMAVRLFTYIHTITICVHVDNVFCSTHRKKQYEPTHYYIELSLLL